MQPTTGYSFGDVVLVPFPFTDQAGTKKRPAVIISSAVYNTAQRDLVIMAVTSQLRPSGALGEALVTGLSATAIDVLVRLERQDRSTQLARLTPSSPSCMEGSRALSGRGSAAR